MTGPSYSAAEIAARFGLELRGDGETGISSVATLARAGAGQLAFLANPRYRNQLSESAASAVVMRADDAQGHDGTALVTADPYVAFAQIAALFEPPPPHPPGVHSSAVGDTGARNAPPAPRAHFACLGTPAERTIG